MRTQLMRTAGQRSQPKPPAVRRSRPAAPERATGLAAVVRAIHRWLALQSCQWMAKASTPARQRPDHIGDVQLLNPAGSKQRSESWKACGGSGHQDQTRRIPVQTMHESKLRAAGLKSGDQGIALMVTKTRLAQQAGGFIDHQILRTLEHQRTSGQLRERLSPGVKA